MKVFLSIALLVVLSGCRNESQTTTSSQSPVTETTTAATTPAPATAAPYDLQFIDTMSKHHQSAVDMAAMASSKVTLPELKAMTKKIPADQKKEIDEMKSWRDKWYPGTPGAENMDMPGMKSSMSMDMSHLQSMKAGKDYDSMFIDMMTPHHQGAIQMAQEALTKAEHPEVKALAQQIIDKQTKEIEQMKQWKSKLGR